MAKQQKFKKVGQKLASLDIFGFPIADIFTVNGKYSVHKTMFGGMTTIVVWILMFTFVLHKLTLLLGSQRNFMRTDYYQTPFGQTFDLG